MVSLLLGASVAVLLLMGGGLRIIPDRLKNLDTYFERTEDQNLIRAVLDGDKRSARRAVESGADVNAVGERGWTPLMLAYSLQDKRIFSLLLGFGADATAVNLPMSKSVMYGVATYPDIYFLQEIVDRGFDVNSRSVASRTPIYAAISANLSRHFLLLLDAGADLEVVDSMEATPLIHSVVMGRFDMAIELISRGARTDVRDQIGRTPYEVLRKTTLPTPPGQESYRERLLEIMEGSEERVEHRK